MPAASGAEKLVPIAYAQRPPPTHRPTARTVRGRPTASGPGAGSSRRRPCGSRAGPRRGERDVGVVVGEGGDVAAGQRRGDREADAAPATPAAEERGRELQRVAVLGLVAGGGDRQHVGEEGEVERARRGAVEAVAGEAEVDHVGAVADRRDEPAHDVREPEGAVDRGAHRQHLGCAGDALAADAVAVLGGDQAGDEGAVAVRVAHVAGAAGGVEGGPDVRVQVGMGDVHAGVDDRHAAPRAAAGRRERRGGADLVVGPRVADAAWPGSGASKGSAAGSRRAVALDVGDAGVASQRRASAAPEGRADGEHAERVDGLDARAERSSGARSRGTSACVRAPTSALGARGRDARGTRRPAAAGAAAAVLAAQRVPGCRWRGSRRIGAGQRQAQLRSIGAGDDRRAHDGTQRLALEEPRPRRAPAQRQAAAAHRAASRTLSAPRPR